MEFTVDNNLTKYSKKYLIKKGNRRELSIGKTMEKTMECSAINNLRDYSGTSLWRTTLVLRKGVHYREVSAIKRFIHHKVFTILFYEMKSARCLE